MEYPQIYRSSITEAREKNETELFRASHKLNIDCKNAIETAIRENFDGMRLKKNCLRPVLEEFGADRMNWVLANTVQQKEYDGRFSRENKEWAKSFQFPEGGASGYDTRWEFIVESHPAVLDGFISLARRELAAGRAEPEKEGRRPSVREQLAMPTVPGDKPHAPNKDREVR